MEKKSGLQARERAFEEEYFSRKDAALIDKLKGVFHKKVDKDSIRAATGINDEALLDRLVDLNLNGELMEAFNLLPLVEVAWADGGIDKREKEAVLLAAEKHGLQPGSKTHALLELRLREGPNEETRKLWFLYAESLRKALTPEQLAEFRTDLVDTCKQIAQASGGLLGIAFTVSPNERAVIEAVERALTV